MLWGTPASAKVHEHSLHIGGTRAEGQQSFSVAMVHGDFALGPAVATAEEAEPEVRDPNTQD